MCVCVCVCVCVFLGTVHVQTQRNSLKKDKFIDISQSMHIYFLLYGFGLLTI